jgi:hypothetical protein
MALVLRGRGAGLGLALLAASACAHGGPARGGPEGWHYDVAVADDLSRLDVSLCFRGGAPARLVAGDDAAVGFLLAPRDARSGRALAVDRASGALELAGAGCLAYAVDLVKMGEEVDAGASARVGATVVASPDLWLWRPEAPRAGADVTLRFALSEGVRASVPWPEEPDGRGGARHRLSSTSFRWASQVVLGRFHEQRFAAAGADFRVAVMDLPRKISDAGVRRWLTTAAETVGGLFGGRFPTDAMQVVVVPYPGGGDPVYFGMALRGGGPSVLLLISSAAEDPEFPGEWVAIHELLHHAMPFVRHADAWLSEGFVTYYTEVLRSRAGFRSELGAWKALSAGFERGRRSGAGLPLAEESARMHEHHAYQRVYWGGAAIALLSDVALRQAGSSLDAAMAHLQACCARSQEIWPATRVLGEWEAWRAAGPAAGASVRLIAGPILRSAGFPALGEVYRKLGVNMVEGELTLDESASIAHVRRAIFSAASL